MLAKKKSASAKKSAFGGALLGFEGQQIWEYLVSNDSDPAISAELRSRYGYILQRHLESIVEQAFFDAGRNKTQIPTNDMSVGGTRGEVRSWIPRNYVQVIYDSARVIARENAVWPNEDSLVAIEQLLGELRMGDLHDAFKDRMSRNVSRLRTEEPQESGADGNNLPSAK